MTTKQRPKHSEQAPDTSGSTPVTALRAEHERLAGKQHELVEEATAAAATAEEAEQRYIDLAFKADVNDDAEAAAACEAARDAADNARREQRRAEASAKRLTGKLAELTYQIKRATEREAHEQNTLDLETTITQQVQQFDEHWPLAMDGLGHLIDMLRTCAERLHAAGLPNEGNTFLATRLRTIRDVVIWDLQRFAFSGGKIRRPLTHAAQGITLEGALSGQQSIPPIAVRDVAVAIDAALATAAVEDQQPDVLSDLHDVIGARERQAASTTSTTH